MGSHSLQGVALTIFLLAAAILSAGISMSGNILLIIVGVAAMAVAVWLFRKCKQLEESQS